MDKSFGCDLLSPFFCSLVVLRRRGIARRLVTHNLDEARTLGCQGVIAEASAYNSQKVTGVSRGVNRQAVQLFDKLGYEALFEVRHEDWKAVNGERIFHCKDSTDKAVLVFTRL